MSGDPIFCPEPGCYEELPCPVHSPAAQAPSAGPTNEGPADPFTDGETEDLLAKFFDTDKPIIKAVS